jgi:hypothetical protein
MEQGAGEVKLEKRVLRGAEGVEMKMHGSTTFYFVSRIRRRK